MVFLRSLAAREYERRHAVARWRRQGLSVRLCEPSKNLYISFWAQGPQGLWQGMVGAREWLEAVLQQWPQSLLLGLTDQEILDLFSAVAQPLENSPYLPAYQHLFQFGLTHGDSLQGCCLPCFTTARGELWVMELPTNHPVALRPIEAWLFAVPQVLTIVLGISNLCRLQLERLSSGDVLFIAEQTRQLFMADRCIGHFTFIQEGLHMQVTPADSDSPIVLNVLSELPVKLEFVLGELTLSIGQLNEFIEHQVLPLEHAAVNSVQVRTGGKVIAIGELIQLDERLGVELLEVYRDIGDE